MGKVALIVCFATLGCIQICKADNFRIRLHEIDSKAYSAEDIQAEVLFGRNIAARVLANLGLWQQDDITHYVNLVGNSLLLYSSRRELNYFFAILDSEKVNAYSTPGGYVFITRGALQACQDESELAAVLAHEIAHVIQRHIVKSLNIRSESSDDLLGLSQMISASANTAKIALSQTVDKAMDLLFKDGYLIQQELDADQLAMLLLAQTGYDPTSLLRYLKRVDSPNMQKLSLGQTHPLSEQRFRHISSVIKQENIDSTAFNNAKNRFDHNLTLMP